VRFERRSSHEPRGRTGRFGRNAAPWVQYRRRAATYVWGADYRLSLQLNYGLPRGSIVRFDVNTSPLPPDLRDVLAGSFRSTAVRVPAERLRRPRGPRRPESYGVRTDEIPADGRRRRGTGPHRSRIPARGFGAVAAVPPTRCIGSSPSSEARPSSASAHVEGVWLRSGYPRPWRQAARGASSSAVRADNPTGAVEPPERIAELGGVYWPLRQAQEPAVRPPAVAIERAYAEFVRSLGAGR